jgi:hypothetical protein
MTVQNLKMEILHHQDSPRFHAVPHFLQSANWIVQMHENQTREDQIEGSVIAMIIATNVALDKAALPVTLGMQNRKCLAAKSSIHIQAHDLAIRANPLRHEAHDFTRPTPHIETCHSRRQSGTLQHRPRGRFQHLCLLAQTLIFAACPSHHVVGILQS